MSSTTENFDEGLQNTLKEKDEISQVIFPNENIYLINVGKKSCRKSSSEEILSPIAFELTGQQYIILLHKPSEVIISDIRKAYKLHPIIEYECIPYAYVADHIIKFDEYLFITLTDIPLSSLPMIPSTVRIILMKKIMFLFIDEPLHCIEEIFIKAMKFDLCFDNKSNI